MEREEEFADQQQKRIIPVVLDSRDEVTSNNRKNLKVNDASEIGPAVVKMLRALSV